jgi:hypothetical protein
VFTGTTGKEPPLHEEKKLRTAAEMKTVRIYYHPPPKVEAQE